MSGVAKIIAGLDQGQPRAIGRAISMVENQEDGCAAILAHLENREDDYLVLGITGPPGAGKSTLTARLIGHFRRQGQRVGVIAVDPSSPLTGGAILGDRIRMMKHATDPDVVIRSMASRGRLGGLASGAGAALRIMAASGCQLIIIETVGVGQSEMDIISLADLTVLALAPGLGDEIQAMKAGLLEVVDLLLVNKFDLRGAEALSRDLAAVVRSRQANSLPPRLCHTVASEGEGVAELAASLAEMAGLIKASGELQRRRQQGRHREVLDWGLELVRQELEQRLAEAPDLEGNPRRLAEELLFELGRDMAGRFS
ncbi:MAG: methylmalonyl Co-A mutase-associated GTPase MeaB [Thermodesulfobacteriota bacterium]